MARGKFKDERKLLADAREGGYAVSQDALTALAKNVLTTQAGIGATFTGSAAKTLQRMAQMQGRLGRRAEQGVERAQNQVANQYGSAVAGGASEAFRPAAAAAKGTGQLGVAGVKAAKGIQTAGEFALAIQQSAADQASESASYMLAQALAYRARDDAALIVEKKLALQQTRLQYKLDLENQKAMYDYTQKQEEKAMGGRQGATELASELTSLLPQIRLWLQQPGNEDATFQEVLTQFKDQLGSNPNAPSYLLEVYSTMKRRDLWNQDLGYAATVDAVVDSLITMNPGWRKWRPALEKWVLQSLKTTWNGLTSGALDEPTPTPSPSAAADARAAAAATGTPEEIAAAELAALEAQNDAYGSTPRGGQ